MTCALTPRSVFMNREQPTLRPGDNIRSAMTELAGVTPDKRLLPQTGTKQAMSSRGGKRSTSFKPGQSGNPGGRPKAIQFLVDLARAETEEAIKKLAYLMQNAKTEAVQAAASNALLDRGWGSLG